MKVKSESEVARLLVTPWTGAYQAPPSVGFSRQEYWSGVPLPSSITLVNIEEVEDRGIQGMFGFPLAEGLVFIRHSVSIH